MLLIHAVRWHGVHIRSDCQPSRHAVAVGRVIPPKIVIVVVASAWPIVIATTARPVGTTVAGPVGATIARPPRKTIVYVGTSVKTSTGPVIISASRRSMMKAIAYMSPAAIAAASKVTAPAPASPNVTTAATAPATAATAASPRLAKIDH